MKYFVIFEMIIVLYWCDQDVNKYQVVTVIMKLQTVNLIKPVFSVFVFKICDVGTGVISFICQLFIEFNFRLDNLNL